jgi:hypothetical protein
MNKHYSTFKQNLCYKRESDFTVVKKKNTKDRNRRKKLGSPALMLFPCPAPKDKHQICCFENLLRNEGMDEADVLGGKSLPKSCLMMIA